MNDLSNQKVAIIGGTSGIGLAAAIQAAEQGATVFAASRNQETIDKAKQLAPSNIEFSSVDTHDAAGLKQFFEQIGELDHLVSAATGANRTIAPFLEQSAEQFSEAFNKFWGYTHVIRQGVPFVKSTGSVVLVSGIPARKCQSGMSSLSCVGSAVEALMRALAVELAPIRVNVASPGVIDTAMFDWLGDNKEAFLARSANSTLLKRVGKAEEVADAILFFLNNPYVTGNTIDVDGGQLLP